MSITSQLLLLSALSLLPSTLAMPAHPILAARQRPSLDGPYTLTAYAPDNATLHGAKAQNGGDLFVPKTSSYCPTIVTNCPNGTETVYYNTLSPSSMVPGSQDLYVTASGQIRITPQHSHAIPDGAYWNYQGWTWTSLADTSSYLAPDDASDCPADDDRYNCGAPSGYWTFQAPDAPEDVGGVVACPGEDVPEDVEAWAVTPAFNRTDCEEIAGLGTHGYEGVSPPVWSYL